MNDTDKDWELFARQDPYWAVLTQERFRTQNLDAASRVQFFSSGEEYIDWVFTTIRSHLNAQFSPRTALDFGCGVGRLVVPLADKCDSVVGVDISETMLGEAKSVCDGRGLTNVRLLKANDNIVEIGTFDFINSYIVFQHIISDRGIRLFKRLISLLSEGGIGAIHLTYSCRGSRSDNGRSKNNTTAWPPNDGIRCHLKGVHRGVRRRLARATGSTVPDSSESSNLPVMQMSAYALNPILEILQEAGIRQFHTVFTDHGGTFGAILLFQKTSGASYQLATFLER